MCVCGIILNSTCRKEIDTPPPPPAELCSIWKGAMVKSSRHPVLETTQNDEHLHVFYFDSLFCLSIKMGMLHLQTSVLMNITVLISYDTILISILVR